MAYLNETDRILLKRIERLEEAIIFLSRNTGGVELYLDDGKLKAKKAGEG